MRGWRQFEYAVDMHFKHPTKGISYANLMILKTKPQRLLINLRISEVKKCIGSYWTKIEGHISNLNPVELHIEQ